MHALHFPGRLPPETQGAKHCLIYFVSGNPGLIGYYHPFLSTLRSLIDNDPSGSAVEFHISGKNLAGFDDGDDEDGNGGFTEEYPPHDLEAQIVRTGLHIASLRVPRSPASSSSSGLDSGLGLEESGSTRLRGDGEGGDGREGTPYDAVIVIGHSVGSYIALELFHRHHIAANSEPVSPSPSGTTATAAATSTGIAATATTATATAATASRTRQTKMDEEAILAAKAKTLIPIIPLHAAILLFPTVTHIGLSPSGRKLSLLAPSSPSSPFSSLPFSLPELPFSLPPLPRQAHLLAHAALALVPDAVLRAVLRRVWGMTGEGAEVTGRWLRSRDGVWQALHMGVDEIGRIRGDGWGRGMWEGRGQLVKGPGEGNKGDGGEDEDNVGEKGEEEESGKYTTVPVPKFFFYYGQGDHWVDDKSRDEFVREREEHKEGRTRVEICERGIPHAFCIHHSETMAEKVKVWIDEIATDILLSTSNI